MAQKFANAARAELSAAINDTDTAFTVVDFGALFPAANTGAAAISAAADWFKAVLQDDAGIEVVFVRTHDVGTTPNAFSNILRGQEGTTARSFSVGAVFGLRPLASDAVYWTGKQNAEVGKGLSQEDYTTAEKGKLAGIEAQAQKNVKSDWNASSGDAQILNKPSFGTAAAKNVPTSGNAAAGEVVLGNDTRLLVDAPSNGKQYARKDAAWAQVKDVLSEPLTGLSLADKSAVTAADTVLQAFGKLQAGKANISAGSLINLLPDSGRFDTSLPNSNNFADAPDIVFSPGGFFSSYNGSTLSEAARSYYDSSTYGGTAPATPATVQDLFTAAGIPGRYQTQFRVLGIAFGSGTSAPGPVVDGMQLYIGAVNALALPRRMTMGMWIRAYAKPLSVLGTVVRPTDGWVKVLGTYSTWEGYSTAGPLLYGQSGGSCEIAMPWVVAGHIDYQPDFQLLAASINPRVFDVPTSTVTSGAYTLQLSDRGNCVDVGHDITVPKLATVAFPKGSVINLQNISGTSRTITAESGATVYLAGDSSKTGPFTLKGYGWVVLRKIDSASTWVISGAGL